MISEQLFSIKEAAAFLKLSKAGFYNLVSDGEIKIAKIGRRSIVTGKEMARFVKTLENQE